MIVSDAPEQVYRVVDWILGMGMVLKHGWNRVLTQMDPMEGMDVK